MYWNIKRPHLIALAAVVVLTFVLLKLPGRATAQFKLAISGLFLPLFGLAGTAHQEAARAANSLAPREVLAHELDRLRQENAELRARLLQADETARENARLRAQLRISEAELGEIGRNIMGVERLINRRLGVTRADDTLPARWFEEPIQFDDLEGCAQLARGAEIGVADVTNALASLEAPLPSPMHALPLDRELREARDAFERIYFEYHLGREAGNMSRVAMRVGLERTHLYRKLKQLGVKLPRRAEE